MCMQSVSLWAEATWYRLGGGQPVIAPEAESDQPGEHAPRAESIDTADEKVLVSR
jgi:hypothetical protein